MKKIGLMLFAFSAALFALSGCASTKSISLSENSPAAIISITGTRLVEWQEKRLVSEKNKEQTDGVLNSLVGKALGGDNPEVANASGRLDYADEAFRRIVPEITGLEVVDKETVLNSYAYKHSRGTLYNTLSDSIKATGYKDLSIATGKKLRKFIKDIGANSLVALDFNFKKVLTSGTKSEGKAAAFVTMKVKICDSSGRWFINKSYEEQSYDSVEVFDGDYDKQEFLNIIKGTIDNLMNKFAVDFIKDDASLDSSTEKEKSESSASENAVSSSSAGAVSTKLGKPKSSVQKNEKEDSKEDSEESIADKKIEETAVNLLKMGLEPEKIAEATGLSIEKVKALEAEIESEKK